MICPPAVRAYLPLIKLAAILIALSAVWWHGHHKGVVSEKTKNAAAISEARKERIADYEAKIEAAKVAQAKSATDEAALKGNLESSQNAYNALLAKIPTKPLVAYEPEKPGDACPPALRLSPDFRLFFNEGIAGHAE